jgi:2-polyprenyl-6-hydroxyphenyl methylase/3-demethylubiquinone-9 3-methyltransferase
MEKSSTIDLKEIKKFSAISDSWWDENGKFKPLHKFNPVRISYIRSKIIEHFCLDPKSSKPFTNLKILDVGCGGGLVAEPMARMGAKVVGVDASKKNIIVAEIHAKKSDLDIDYRPLAIEELDSQEKFDVILMLEIIEHVSSPEELIKNASLLLKENGLIFIATINRNLKSFLSAIVGAEYILRWLDIGTHDFKKFLKPSEVNKIATNHQLTLNELKGVKYNIFADEFKISDNVDVNYVAVFCNGSYLI